MKLFKTAAAVGLVVLTGMAHAAGVSGQGSWETTLQARDIDKDGTTDAFYDTELNITWLRATSTSATNWATAKAWAENSNFFGLSGWRLPTTRVTTSDGSCDWSLTGGTSCGFNPDSSVATGSEMAHLFFKSLGNKSYFAPGTTNPDQPGWGLSNTGDFRNLQSFSYWSETKYAPDSNLAWFFDFVGGSQDRVALNFAGRDTSYHALAVRPGDVTAAVPEPETYALLLAGLSLVAGVARRRSKQQ